MKKIILLLALSLFFAQDTFAQFSSVKPLKSFSLSTNTREKPQSKVWMHDGKHFSVLANSSGTHVFRLDGDSIWTKTFTLTSNSSSHADCKVVGNVVHVFLFRGNSSELISIEYVASNSTYKLWATRTSTVGISTDSDAETATIDIDATGRMWVAYDTDNSIKVRWSNSPYSTWSAPVVVASGILPDDIGAVIAFPMFNKIGVFWSNQDTQRFGFKMHSDTAPDSIWSADEVPASQSALNVGNGFSDDHMNFKVGSNGTLYCAVKTSYDKAGYTKISLLVRRPNGTWDNIYKVSEIGTRGIVLVNELVGKIRVIYTEDEADGDIFYRESSLSSISFGSQRTLIAGKYNNPTSIKGNHTFEVAIIASTSSQAVSVLATDDPPVPEAPTLNLPANGAGSFPVASSLSWNAPLFAKTYQVQVATSSTFQNLIYDGTNITNTSTTVPGLNWSTQYYWRVRAANQSGASPWSVVRNFTTEPIPLPGTPGLVSPVNSATQVSNPPVFTWNAANYATTYQLQIATSSGFQTIVSDVNNIANLTLTAPILNWSTQYYWRVRAVNASGNGSWSSVRNFTTRPIPLPEPPALASPAKGTTNVVLPAVLTWNAGNYATTYQLQLANSHEFLTIVSDINNISALTRTVSGLDWSTEYFWRVRSINTSGTSAWSDTSRFISEAIPVPVAPTLVSPASSAINIPISTTLSWNAVTYAQSYQMQLSTSPDFLAIVQDNSQISTTNTNVSGLNYSTQYYWRIRASNTSGASSWSAVRSFTTVPPIPAAPVLAAPADMATGIAIAPTLSWNATAHAATYQMQLSTTPDFLTTVSNVSNLTTLNTSVSGLAFSTQYFWRVRATNITGTSPWSVVRSFTTIPIPIPAAPALSSPSNGATGVAFSPTLSWNAVTYAETYQMQLSATSDFLSPVADVSNLTTLNTMVSALAYSTQYFWRVRASNTSGAGSWSAVRSFTTVPPPPVPGVPSLSSPSSGATSIAIARNFSWNASSNAYYYQLQLATTSDFQALFKDTSNITTLSVPISGMAYSTKYYWRVRAINTTGASNWSSVRSFTTVPVPIPAAPTLNLPATAATGIALPAALSWNAVLNAATYRVQVATSSGFGTIVSDVSNITTLNSAVSGLNYSTQYFWRVRAVNSSGSSSWSSSRSFTTMPIPMPVAPVLVAPASSATGISNPPTLSWNTGDYAESYQLQVATAADFLTPVSDIANITTLSSSVSGLNWVTQYYWRVRSVNASGVSSWSEVRSFTTMPIPIPVAPALSSPSNGATGVAYSPTLSWNAVTYAETYQVQLATTSDFISPVYDISNLTTLNTVITALAYSTQYFWRVRALNTSGAGSWSVLRSFTTVPPPPLPGTPSLSSPSSGATGVAVARNFSWNSASNAYYYQLQFSTVSSFASIFKDTSNITTRSVPISGLAYSTKYYWRVRAINTTGIGSWSSVRSFTTESVPAPAAPVQNLPANAATTITLPVALSWNAVLNAATYRVQVATSSGFGTIVADVSNITALNTTVNGLNFSTQYFWRVRAINAAGTSSWSTIRSFTTQAIALPGQATLASPANNASAVMTPVSLNWNAGPYGESYHVQVSAAANFLTPAFDVNNITSLNTTVAGLAYNTLYYWRVRTNNASGVSAWSATWSFTTGSQPATLVGHWEMEETSGATLNDASSFNNHGTTVNNPTKVAGVIGQALQLNGTSQYATVSSSASLNVSNAVTLAAWVKPEQTGSAQVIIKKGVTGSADGYELSLTSTSKIMFRYNQVSAGDTYRLLATTLHPSNGNTWMHIAATFDGVSMKIYVDGNLDKTLTLSSPPAIGSNNLPLSIGAQSTGTNRFKGAIDEPRVYNVALSAADINALATMPTFRPVPNTPALVGPADNVSNISLPVTLSWSAVTNAVSYQVQVAPAPDFASPAADISNITELNVSVSGLNYSTPYYWRVRAVNSSGESGWSSARTFTTEAVALPGPPTLDAPVNNATAVAIPALLSWTAGTYATTYQVQVATTSAFLNLVSNETNITTLSTAVAGLAYNTVYYWRVRTVNAAGTSSWTTPRSFTTKSQSTTLVGFWQMEETTGTTLFDASANANNATTVGNPAKVAGVAGQALQLNGSSQYATVPSSASLNISNAITLAAWIKPEQTGSAQVIMKKGLTGDADGYELSLTSTRKILFRYNQVSGGSDYKAQSAILHPTDGATWMHIAATFDGTTIKIYVNGVLDRTETLSSPPAIASNNLPLAIGGQSIGNNLFKGAIDNPKIYNVALSSSDISSLASISSARMASGSQESTIENLVASPNPFMNATSIHFTVPESGAYSVTLYNMAGHPIKVLQKGYAKAGENLSMDLDGSKLTRGLYLVRLQNNKKSETLKLVHDVCY
ncbi:T9SS type A sorting domain-containing protein [Adhaeribacter sp. BT258]|uniref:T9SS type A sorting domain-containing protein n=1 Tax=Adhaeribacter terrigena TaxID=2793070 RepID=A0ABS1C0W6_9BACT|nr:LamG-like jellyroll fold domain-containing protein [Adhaeribacter terrigena]MBK0403045.1 T9SS type A sorting domain-containing protein [Adhaeribacter terrigena]